MGMRKTCTDQLQSQIRNDTFINMNAVGIGISKRKSTVAILRSGGTVAAKPFDTPICPLIFNHLRSLSGILMVKRAWSWSVLAITTN